MGVSAKQIAAVAARSQQQASSVESLAPIIVGCFVFTSVYYCCSFGSAENKLLAALEVSPSRPREPTWRAYLRIHGYMRPDHQGSR